MAWYDKNAISERQIFIQKPYSLENLLDHREMLMKEIAAEKELQSYINNHRNKIVHECLQVCLQPAATDASYSRKYSLPTKAIELMTHEHFFRHLGWNQELAHQYFQQMIDFFLKVDHHVENINLHHAYFEGLMVIWLNNARNMRLDIGSIIQQHQATANYIPHLFQHINKHGIGICLEIIMNYDMFEANLVFPLDFKMLILRQSLSAIEMYATDRLDDEQKVESCLYLVKTHLNKCINFIIQYGYVPAEIRNKPDCPLNIKLSNILATYYLIQDKFQSVANIILNNKQKSLQILAIDVFFSNQKFLLLAKRPEIKPDWSLKISETIIEHFLSIPLNICHPFFVDWMILLFSQAGQNPDQIQILGKHQIAGKLFQLALKNYHANILVTRVFEFLKSFFCNLEEEIKYNIVNNLSNPQKIAFPMFQQFFEVLPMIESVITQFKGANDPLFTSVVRFYKIIYNISKNIIELLNYYNSIDICNKSKQQITKLIQFYSSQQCFRYYDQQLSKDLGRFFNDETFSKLQPVQFSVVTPPEKAQKSQIITVTTTPAIVLSQPIQAEPSPIENKQITEITVPPALTVPIQPKENVEVTSSEIKVAIESKNDKVIEKKQEKSDSYQSFMQKRLRESQSSSIDRRSKSRTPTKIKNEIKKAKNKWQEVPSNQQNEDDRSPLNQNETRPRNKSSPHLQKQIDEVKLKKISFVRISRSKTPKIVKERLIDPEKDNRLLGWLNVLKQIR